MNHALQPPRSSTPFFRRSTSLSSTSSLPSSPSSLDGSTSSDDSLSLSDSESDSDSEGSQYSSSSGASSSSILLPHLGTRSSPPTRRALASNQSRSSLKLSLSYLRARQSLSSHSFDSLASSLKTLSSLLPASSSPWDPIATFIPILERFSRDLESELAREETGTREFRRRTMGKEDAKAFVALKQSWSRLHSRSQDKGKGKNKESDLDWVSHVRDRVEKNPRPSFLLDSEYLIQTRALLGSLESILLPSCSIPRLSLANLGLTTAQLEDWTALAELEQVIDWYFGFSITSAGHSREILSEIKSLDLSRNRLTSFPCWLPELFPSLETLSLSHNQFQHLPPSIMLFSNMHRLRTHGNHLVSSSENALLPLRIDLKRETKLAKRGKGTRANSKRILHSLVAPDDSPTSEPRQPRPPKLPSLFRISAEILLLLLLSTPPSSSDDHFDSSSRLDHLPPHLASIVSTSYICVSCHDPILSVPRDSNRYLCEPLYERIHFVSPGISIPTFSSSSSGPGSTKTDSDPRRFPVDHSQAEEEEDEEERELQGIQNSDRGGGEEEEAEIRRRRREGTKRDDELASFEQLLLLAVYNRYDSQPPPPPPPPPPNPAIARSTRRLTLERQKQNRRRGLPTIVIGGEKGGGGRDGGNDEGEGRRIRNQWRFCVDCAKLHLGIEKSGKRGSGRKICGCFVCREERRVRGIPEKTEHQGGGREAGGEERVLRWLRRRERVKDTGRDS